MLQCVRIRINFHSSKLCSYTDKRDWILPRIQKTIFITLYIHAIFPITRKLNNLTWCAVSYVCSLWPNWFVDIHFPIFSQLKSMTTTQYSKLLISLCGRYPDVLQLFNPFLKCWIVQIYFLLVLLHGFASYFDWKCSITFKTYVYIT